MGNLLKTQQSQQSNKSIPLIPHPPNYPIPINSLQQQQQQILYDTLQSKQQMNIYDFQNTANSNEIQQRFMIHSNSIGQHALDSVISKYVKHNKHTQQTINHHKCWLKSFQNELRNVSHTITDYKKHKQHKQHKEHRQHKQRSNSNDEVVIRVKIEK